MVVGENGLENGAIENSPIQWYPRCCMGGGQWDMVVIGGVTSYVDLYQDHPSMIFCLFLTAGHLSHSTLVADQEFLTAEAKNVAYSSRNFSFRSKTLCRNSNVFSSFLAGRRRGTDSLSFTL
jgi:hypothetical protein